jgi:hypothetical protein
MRKRSPSEQAYISDMPRSIIGLAFAARSFSIYLVDYIKKF